MIDIRIRISRRLVLFVVSIFLGLLVLSYALSSLGGHSQTRIVTVQTGP